MHARARTGQIAFARARRYANRGAMNARPPLTADQTKALKRAQQLLRAGNPREAADLLRPLLAGGLVHADAYLLFAQACRATGLPDGARKALNAAINLDPNAPVGWAALGELLEETGDLATALVARRRLADLDSDVAEAWLALGNLLLRIGDAAGAEEPLRRALEIESGSIRAGHALALALRMQDRAEEGIAVTAPLAARADAPAQTGALHGHLLGDLGRFDEAVDQYRSVLVRHPDTVDAHETLARLLPQLGRGGEALDSYTTALTRLGDRNLWRSAIFTARSLRRWEACLQWSEAARWRFPDDRQIAVAHADALAATGEIAKALALIDPLTGSDAMAAMQAAHWRLASRDPQAAEKHALAATRLAPDDQTGWAYLATCWRLLEDPREAWLIDYDRHVTTMMLEPPAGYSDLAGFMADLRAALDAAHVTTAHPDDQSLRQGTQTRGHLFMGRDPTVRALSHALHRQIEAWLATLPKDANHPFLRRNTGRIGFKHSWSVRLNSSGYHVSHIHQDGWLSSAFYVALPPEMEAASEEAGVLRFGVPDDTLGLDLPPRRVVRPEVGKLALFPSYVWHGTTPFASDQPRMTVAFDALPIPA